MHAPHAGRVLAAGSAKDDEGAGRGFIASFDEVDGCLRASAIVGASTGPTVGVASPGAARIAVGGVAPAGARGDAFIACFGVPQPPGMPESVAVEPGAGELRVSWAPPADDGGNPITRYRVLRGASPAGPFVPTGDVSAPSAAYVDSGLPPGTTCYCVASAANVAGEGPASAADGARTFDFPGRPAGLAASAGPAAGEITLSWRRPTTTAARPS